MCMRDQKRQQGLSVVRHGPGVHGGGDWMGKQGSYTNRDGPAERGGRKGCCEMTEQLQAEAGACSANRACAQGEKGTPSGVQGRCSPGQQQGCPGRQLGRGGQGEKGAQETVGEPVQSSRGEGAPRGVTAVRTPLHPCQAGLHHTPLNGTWEPRPLPPSIPVLSPP